MQTSALKVAAAALALTGFAAAAVADTEDQLSEQSYQVEITVDANHLSCYFTPGRPGGYIPIDTAWANLSLVEADEVAVFTHQAASVSVEGEGDAGRLCPFVQAIVADAAAHGNKLTVSKTATLSILKYPNAYTGTCERYLKEAVTVRFTRDVALVSEQYKGLAPTRGNCN